MTLRSVLRGCSCILAFFASSFVLANETQDYVVAPGDIISVTVFDEPELSVSAIRIPANRIISYPLLGRVNTRNHTVASLEKHITSLLLNGYLKKPVVSIAISGYRPFFVRGDVDRPGQHDFSEGMTLEKALTVAGGSMESGDDDTKITVTRGNSNPVKVADLKFAISPGDVITVDRADHQIAEESTNYVYMYGEVSSPGGYEFRKGLTIEKAIAMAGGFTDRASKRKIDVSRYTEGEGPTTLEKVDLTEEVYPGDVITVGESWF